MRFQHHRRVIAVAMLALSAPLDVHAAPPDDDASTSRSPASARDAFPSWTAPTLSDMLTHEALRAFRTADTTPLDDRSTPSLMRESLNQRLRQRMQSRLRRLPQDMSHTRDREPAGRLTPIARQENVRHADVVDLKHQQSSWLALVAAEYHTAAAHLHDALLRGRPATACELHQIAGSERAYEIGFGQLTEAAGTDQAGKAERFLLAYHAALKGEKSLARAALQRFDHELPQKNLDPIVRFRLLQLLE